MFTYKAHFMNINDMYQICQFAINKAQNGYLSPSQFNLIINQAQVSFQDYLLGEFQQYQYGKGTPRVDYSLNETTRQRLAPLIASANLTIDANGEADYPEDYSQTDSMRNPTTFDRIRYVEQDSLYSYYNSHIDPIATNPIYLLQPTGYQFYPKTLGTAKLTYVRTAPDMVWAYTLDVNNRPVYSPVGDTGVGITPTTGSVDPVWYDVDKLEIISRALKLIGVNLQTPLIEQYANQVTQIGQ